MTTRRLYHFPSSAFSRRARLALAHKGLEVELRDARGEPKYREEAEKLCAVRTIPVLAEPDGFAIGDSTVIAHYLDRAYPAAPALFPARREDARAALEAVALVDVGLNTLVDLGTRYYALHGDAAWEGVKRTMLGRIRTAFDALAARAKARTGTTWTDSGWCLADMWVAIAVMWIEGWPPRAPTTPNVAQLVSLGFTLPADLSRWTDAHRARADIAAL